METLIRIYNTKMAERYLDLKNSGNPLDHYNLSKLFEYYTCIQLMHEHQRPFFEYNDTDPTFKEINQMSKQDTGIDCCDTIDTIVQCKLRKDTLTWTDCGTFLASQNIFDEQQQETVVRWKKMILARNECHLSKHLDFHKKRYQDKVFMKQTLIDYCETLLVHYIEKMTNKEPFVLRDYQKECIDLITQSDNNVIVSLPTGTGKNSCIIYSMQEGLRYLILVPRIILMEQFKTEIGHHRPEWKSMIQCIGDNQHDYDECKSITICVFNSIHIVDSYLKTYDKIYIDEAHHIYSPDIYDDEENHQDDSIDNVDELDDESIDDIGDGDESTDNVDDYDESTDSVDNEEQSTDSVDNDDESIDDINDDDQSPDNADNDESDSVDNDDESTDNDDQSINNDDQVENNAIISAKKKSKQTYKQRIRKLAKYKNNILLSATIDKVSNFEYYHKDIRTMIDQGYLTDYIIHVPLFSNDPTNTHICTYLLNHYRNIIIYCGKQKEGKEINALLNQLQPHSAMYIDCHTSKKDRKDILAKYKRGEIPFLVNVKVLVDGFDAPITRGVCFLHMPKKKTTLVQIIGRALRIHSLKKYADIILPCSSQDDESSICHFLKIMSQHDRRIKQSYERKQLGGYINIRTHDIHDDVEFKYDMIYNSMGVLITLDDMWKNKFHLTCEYSNIEKKAPTMNIIYKQVRIGKWFSHQKYKINDITDEFYKKLSENIYIKKSLDTMLENKEKTKLTTKEWIDLILEYSQ